MQIISTSTDKNSDMHYCCWADVKEGRILSISDETGREGGELWSREYFSGQNGGLVKVMDMLARTWPNWYDKVRKAAYRDKLPTLREIRIGHKASEIARLEEGIAQLKKSLNEKETELRKVKSRRIS